MPIEPDEAAVKEVLQAEQDLYRAMIARDFAALERILSPDIAYVHSTAVAETREEYLAAVAAGLYEYESIASREVRVRIHGVVALVDGICDMRVGAGGGPKELIHLLFVLAWTRQDGGWRLEHRHATRIPLRHG
jgi:ketosteroid isomerase-like protein